MDSVATLEWIAIGLMGIVTFVTRVAGVGLAKWIPQTPFWRRFVNYLPATLLVAIAAPVFASGDLALTLAAALTLLCALSGLHLVACMGVGMAAVALLRLLLP
jgi:uncharacterized membrane protein